MTQNRPAVGQPDTLESGIARVLAPNASPMTYWGTNTYLVGHDRLCVIDPGPMDAAHLEAMLQAINGRTVDHILVTHSHLDHSPLARPLSEKTGAPVFGFGDSTTGRSDIMKALGDLGGGEGVDQDFVPDEILTSGAKVLGDGYTLTALHTPGHFGNHLCYLMGNTGFTGDHLMGWASSLVSPPDGDLTDFMTSCHALAATGVTRAYAGHGAPIADAQKRLADLIAHRLTRQSAILDALSDGPATPADLTARIYTDVAPALFPMAMRNVLAHLIDLTSRDLAYPVTPLSADAKFALK